MSGLRVSNMPVWETLGGIMKLERDDAKKVILENCRLKPSEVVTLDSAYGRILAKDVLSLIDIPDENKSAIDGFAFSHESVTQVPVKLKIVGETPAGSEKLRVRKGEAVFVMTGGVLPEGADSAVRVEDVEVKDGYVLIDSFVERGNLVNFKSSEISKGIRIIEKGVRLDERLVGLLAYVGVYRVEVFSKPKVGVFITGDEVLEPYEQFKPGYVRNSNLYIIKGVLSACGIDVHYLGRLKDDPDLMEKRIGEALQFFDVVITTGGISKGKYDFVKDVVEKIGVDIKIRSTNIRPGRPLIFGLYGESLFFGLPGYPSAMLVNVFEFLLPALRKMSGLREFENRYVDAIAMESLRSRKGRVDFVRVNFEFKDGQFRVYSSGSQQTSNYLTAALCDGFAVVPEELEGVKEGDIVKILPLKWRYCG